MGFVCKSGKADQVFISGCFEKADQSEAHEAKTEFPTSNLFES